MNPEFNLPDSSDFFQRTHLYHLIEEKVVSPCIIVIYGVTGSGKTMLAIESAQSFLKKMKQIAKEFLTHL